MLFSVFIYCKWMQRKAHWETVYNWGPYGKARGLDCDVRKRRAQNLQCHSNPRREEEDNEDEENDRHADDGNEMMKILRKKV